MSTVCVLDISEQQCHVTDIARLRNLWYGTPDSNLVLSIGEEGALTVLYDPSAPARGIEVFFQNDKLNLRHASPTSASEIRLYYDLIRALLYRYSLTRFVRNGYTITTSELDEFVSRDLEECSAALEAIEAALEEDESGYYIFGVYHPLCLDRSIMARVGTSVDEFEKYLSEIQRERMFYCAPAYFTHNLNHHTVGVYYVFEDLDMIVPLNPDPAYRNESERDYYVMLPGENDLLYRDFIDSIHPLRKYDLDHVVVRLDYTAIKYLAKFAVDVATGEHITPTFYWGKPFDEGDYHARKIEENGFPLESLAGYNHLAIFLRWMGEHDMISKQLYEAIPELREMIAQRQDLREMIAESTVFEGALKPGHFNQAGRLFAQDYYRVDEHDLTTYPANLDLYAEHYFGWNVAHSKRFNDQAYLFVPFDEDYYQGMKKFIDQRWEKFLSRKASTLVASFYGSGDDDEPTVIS